MARLRFLILPVLLGALPVLHASKPKTTPLVWTNQASQDIDLKVDLSKGIQCACALVLRDLDDPDAKEVYLHQGSVGPDLQENLPDAPLAEEFLWPSGHRVSVGFVRDESGRFDQILRFSVDDADAETETSQVLQLKGDSGALVKPRKPAVAPRTSFLDIQHRKPENRHDETLVINVGDPAE